MKKNINFAFTLGYIAGLQKKLLNISEIEKLRSCKNIEEFKHNIKSINSDIIEFNDYNDFEDRLNIYLNSIISDIENICPENLVFSYIFCKNDFINLKGCLNWYFFKNHSAPIVAKPFKISPDVILKCIETKNFEYIKEPFKEAFCRCFDIMSTIKNRKIVEILIDKNMYEVLFKLSKKENFLVERTKLEATLKNINFCVRYLKYKENLKDLHLYILENSYIETNEYLKAAKKGLKYVFSLFSVLDIKDFDVNLEENFNLLDKICEDRLRKFDREYIHSSFSFIPIFKYIKCLQNQLNILKEILISIIYKNI